MVIIRFMIDTQMTRIAIRFEQEKYFWGDAFLSSLSKDFKKEFPDMKGFSEQNLRSIRYWYQFYSDFLIRLQLVSELENIEKD